MRKKTVTGRIDEEFANDAKEIMKLRLEKGLAKFNLKDIGLPEFTRLFRRTNGYKIALEELKVKPKRK